MPGLRTPRAASRRTGGVQANGSRRTRVMTSRRMQLAASCIGRRVRGATSSTTCLETTVPVPQQAAAATRAATAVARRGRATRRGVRVHGDAPMEEEVGRTERGRRRAAPVALVRRVFSVAAVVGGRPARLRRPTRAHLPFHGLTVLLYRRTTVPEPVTGKRPTAGAPRLERGPLSVPPPTSGRECQQSGPRNDEAPDLHRCRSGASGGAACRNRTDDLFITSESLYRLS